jgi:hypothetical protein
MKIKGSFGLWHAAGHRVNGGVASVDGPGFEFRQVQHFFFYRPDRQCGPPSFLYNGYGDSLPGR